MTMVDERGRLFGRFNLIDAAVVLVVVVLIPIAYAAYLLFRPQAMAISSVEPSHVVMGQTPRIRIHGDHLRPYLRAQIGPAQPHTFLIESPDEGELVLPELPAGTFDLALYDEVQEVARLKNAITVTALPPLPRVNIRLVGAFLGLDDATAATLTVGRKFPNDPPAMFEILDVGHASEDVRRVRPLIGSEAVITVPVAGRRQLPAVVRAGCQPSTENQTCSFGDAVAGIGATVTLPGGFSFVIDDIRPDAAGIPVVARIQFVGRPETVDLIAVGDIDASPRSDAARVIAVRNRTVVSGQVARQTSSTAVLETSTMPERLGSVEVDLRVVADQTAGGIAYRLQALKAGAPFAFDTSKYVVHGTVVSVVPAPQAAR